MPVPIILGAIAAGAALYGAAKGINAAMDHTDASDLNDAAKSLVDNANRKLEAQRDTTNDVITDYGTRKLRAFNGAIADFIENFERLKNVELIHPPELEKLKIDNSDSTLSGLRNDYQALKDAGLGLGAGLGGGAALAFGAYNGTMMLAAASTGTAISSLTGVAATNATLAWLGGGSLTAGGLGMAGGMWVLGGIVAGPALAIFGHIMGDKGEAALNNARTNQVQAQAVKDEVELMIGKLQAIEQVSSLANMTFSRISSRLRHSVRDLRNVIDSNGNNYSEYPQDCREVVFRAVKFAQLIKVMIDMPILDLNGNLVLSTEKGIQDIQGAIV